jgi:hypothetical protein
MAARIVFRSWAAKIGTVLFGGLSVAGVSVAVLRGSVAGSVLFGAIAAVFAALAVRSARAGIVCDDVGLTGRTDRYTHRVAWREVDRFDFRPFRGVGAWTTDGKWIALQDFGLQERSAAQDVVARLTELREGETGQASA